MGPTSSHKPFKYESREQRQKAERCTHAVLKKAQCVWGPSGKGLWHLLGAESGPLQQPERNKDISPTTTKD